MSLLSIRSEIQIASASIAWSPGQPGLDLDARQVGAVS